RRRGHTVWLGEVTSTGEFAWSDGNGNKVTMMGFHQAIDRWIGHPLSPLLTRYIIWQFLCRVRHMIRELAPDIVQVNPDLMPWLIPLSMPHTIKFIFDVKQINMGVKPTFTNRIRDWGLGMSWRVAAKFVYDYACFDYYLAAERIVGKGRTKFASSIPVGIDEAMLTAKMSALQLGDNQPVRFLYIGSINRFRELERLLDAIRLAVCRREATIGALREN
ncbi:MAG: hypothetical protein ACOYKN_21545, partial [Pirellula sp.]